MSAYSISPTDLPNADLMVDAIYQGTRKGNSGDDPLPSLLSVSNMGGFRILGKASRPRLIVLNSSFADPDWPDSLDGETGVFTYYGDNKTPGSDIHATKRWGNTLLRFLFDATHARDPLRWRSIPPVLVFRSTGSYRDKVFLGLAVPGAAGIPPTEDLVAVWKSTGGHRFQNYRAIMTILNVPSLPRTWLQGIIREDSCENLDRLPGCPRAWMTWRSSLKYEPLTAQRTVQFRTKTQQLPGPGEGMKLVECIHKYFESNPIGFEACAATLVGYIDPRFTSFDLTRPTRDGGRDAIGFYRLGLLESAISIDCAIEAKCFRPGKGVGVKGLSRLISRLRHRQFGVLVTTSYLDIQAYKELVEDRHPVIIVAAADIVEILRAVGISTLNEVQVWLEKNFGLPSELER